MGPVAMDAEVELLAVHDKAFVERGEQQELVAAEAVQGHCQQSVVAAGVARHDGCVDVRSVLFALIISLFSE